MFQYVNINPQEIYHGNFQQCQAIDQPKIQPINSVNINSHVPNTISIASQSTTAESFNLQVKSKNAGCSEKKFSVGGAVDTSNFTIEERLIAAVWVHERKRLRLSIGHIKRDFRARFGKEPPTKNTLLVWERKLFSSGTITDARRSGRPTQRKAHASAVQASVRQAPTLSLRARAAALQLSRTTLRNILRDLHEPARPRPPHAPLPPCAAPARCTL